MGIGKELPPSRVTVWLGQLSEKIRTTDVVTPSKVCPPSFPWLKKDLPPATSQDDDPTLQWGDWSGKTNYDATPPEDLRERIGSWMDVD